MSYRPYQSAWKSDIRAAWANGARNVMGTMPTGGGKTHTFTELAQEEGCPVVNIVHRNELVSQICDHYASNGIEHGIIAPRDKVRTIMDDQLRDHGRCYVHPNAQINVVGVDTFIRRLDVHRALLEATGLWICDEAHHLLAGNKWGTAVAAMPNAKGLGVTATPSRADGLGLSRQTAGVFDAMIQGPTMRELIDAGWLTDYRIFLPPTDVHYDGITIGGSGDYVQSQLIQAVRDSHLVGDVVENYQKIAPGKRAVVFATDVETAQAMADKFNDHDVPAAMICGKTPHRERVASVQAFKTGRLQVLVTVDVISEGFDLPAIEVAIFARRTMSLGLYFQQFGRALRPMEGKDKAIIIDHAGNCLLHGLPDKERRWSLDGGRPPAVDPDDDIALRYCAECTQPYEVFHRCCPHCGYYPEPASRSEPRYVQGDLQELTPEALAALRGEVQRVQESPQDVMARMRYAGAPEAAWRGAGRRVHERAEAHAALRVSIDWFAHVQQELGLDISASHRKFWHLFGVDVLTAQTLSRPEAIELATRINMYLGEKVV